MTTPTREQVNKLLEMIQRHFPSLPMSDTYTDWKKWSEFAQAAFLFGASEARADLEAELESLRKDASWISVEDRLPEPDVSVLVTREGKQLATKTCHDGREWLLESIHYPVTHWMPLPEIAAAPKEK